jgi:hypothetical protein
MGKHRERNLMKRIFTATLCALVLSGVWSFAGAEKLFSMKIGTTWPQALLSTGIPAGDAELNYGMLIDRKIGFGIAADFLWNIDKKEATTGTHFTIVNEKKTFMFPIMGFFLIDPLPDLMVHPVARFEIGYNSLIYSYKYKETADSVLKPLSPYFYGLIMKASLDGLYNLGERSALFLGLEYQWAGTTTTNTQGVFDKRDMSGIGLRAGFRVLL